MLREHIARIEHQRAIAQKDVPHTSTTQELESAIAQMGRKLEEADETRLMYLQMIARLKGESTFFNRDLSRLKAATNAKEQDEVELQLMLKDATYARNDAKQRCHEVEQATHAEERRRAKELARREQQLEQRRQQCAEHESACAARRHELLVAQEQAHASIERTIRNPSTIDEELAQIHQYEEEFKKMQNMAGASEVQDIISKFLRQEDTYNMLTMMTRDSHLRIGASKEAKAEAHAAVERLRYEGVGEEEDAPSGRHASAVTSLVDFGADSAAAARTWSSQHDSRLRRTARTLIDVRAGVQHLVDLLASSQALDLEEFNGSLDGDDTLVAVRGIASAQTRRADAALATRSARASDGCRRAFAPLRARRGRCAGAAICLAQHHAPRAVHVRSGLRVARAARAGPRRGSEAREGGGR